ncbi:adventurous gliding motility lipoprotein CglC [Archangium sp.]|jgi:hypothetical protein|uniref:adventurous gliding motility lipoprotein CglC n=1 Tax=Archangium sp. TaxID=1872627 RepID=UPI002ED8CD8C
MSARLALLVGAALVLGGCEIKSDIGKSCVLVRKATDQELKDHPELGKTRDIMESELREGQDFISFGSVECEDLICVRDGGFEPGLAAGTDLTKTAAKGYCSKACLDGALQNNCAVTDPAAVESVKDRMACRALLLDQKALEDLKASDPAAYSATFGDNNSPSFCAAESPPAGN